MTFGRIGKALDLAKQSREASRESATLTDQDTAVRIAEAYYGVVLAKELAQIAHQNKQLADLHLNDALAHLKAGLRSDFDVMQNRAEVSSAEANVIELESREEIAKKALLSAMGQPLDRDVEVAENFREEVVEGDADELVATGVSRRRELVLLNLQSGMSRTAAGLYTANMLPTIDARMDYTWSGVSQTEEDRVWPVEDDWRNFWSVGVGLTWPIFDGFENWGKRRQALAQERISKLRLAQSERTIALEIEQLTKRRDALMKQLTARKDAVDLAQRAFELASLRYDSGLGTLIERADAKAVWTRARVALLQTLYDLNLARVHLRRALGE
ncbi:MAG: TolC family protein [Deltaproteobacteria bacterium]|nr:TolC family protein [Deltaproteobacteria bacterium]